MDMPSFLSLARVCAERIRIGDFCTEDEAIVFAASHLEAINSAAAKKSTTAGDCDPETMVVALPDIEHLLED
ncbi:MAG: hypothetical protein IBX50_15895 [Marinospirillum sp.]|uniref:hypothetical protein n=1 Tax=Marinospirillum sp. TaxID=2183934 RepID=UPI0019EB4D63|nr:hypothetical protein [Marinospirillum sp.]MBE0508172.1 hypothetical protein [Marinospirillum sp.]